MSSRIWYGGAVHLRHVDPEEALAGHLRLGDLAGKGPVPHDLDDCPRFEALFFAGIRVNAGLGLVSHLVNSFYFDSEVFVSDLLCPHFVLMRHCASHCHARAQPRRRGNTVRRRCLALPALRVASSSLTEALQSAASLHSVLLIRCRTMQCPASPFARLRFASRCPAVAGLDAAVALNNSATLHRYRAKAS
jgi:hypothetical protein